MAVNLIIGAGYFCERKELDRGETPLCQKCNPVRIALPKPGKNICFFLEKHIGFGKVENIKLL